MGQPQLLGGQLFVLRLLAFARRLGGASRLAALAALARRRAPTVVAERVREIDFGRAVGGRGRGARRRFGTLDRIVEDDALVQVHLVGGHERAVAAQPIGDDRVGVGFAQHLEGATEALDVGAVPRLTGHEILADDARLEAAAGVEVGVGELGLRGVHRRLEAAVDADLDQPHQRDDVAAHAGDELVQGGRRRRVVALGQGGVGHRLDAGVGGVGRLLGEPAGHRDGRLALCRIGGQRARHRRPAVVEAALAQLGFGQRHPQRVVEPGDVGRRGGGGPRPCRRRRGGRGPRGRAPRRRTD